MATRITYTSTIRVPIYASWKCSKCNEINFSLGNIKCESQATTNSWRRAKQDDARNKASSMAQTDWKGHALQIICNPRNNAQNMRGDLFLNKTKCTNCRTKPKWDKGTGYLIISSLAIIPTIISGLIAFILLRSFVAWLIFAISLGAFVYGIVTEKAFIKTIANLPQEYMPVIGSLNEELIDYAKRYGKTVPTPDDTVKMVGNYGVRKGSKLDF